MIDNNSTLFKYANMDYETLIDVINKNPNISADACINIILATNSRNFYLLKSSNCYNKIINFVLNSNDVIIKTHFILYCEPDMLGMMFNDMRDLIDQVSYSEFSKETKIEYLLKILFNLDDIVLEKRIMNTISRLYDEDFDKYSSIKEYKIIK